MGLESVYNFVCSANTFTRYIYQYLPFIYSLVTIIFIILGVIGIIVFTIGIKFKNVARNIYAFIHLITSLISMLLIFHVTFCSTKQPTSNTSEVAMQNKQSMYSKFQTFRKGTQGGGGGGALNIDISQFITKAFGFLNTLLESNSLPIIIIQVLCTSIIVIVCTFMSTIFSGISKAGYEMHCINNNEFTNVPWWGKLVDFFMHILLIASTIFFVFYLFFNMAKQGFTSLWQLMSELMGRVTNKAPSPDEAIQEATVLLPQEVRGEFLQFMTIIDKFPIIRASFVISLSYYITQLFLRTFEDIISNNIVSLISWQKRETECVDDPNKKSKTEIENGFALFGNILLFIAICIITIFLLIAHMYFVTIMSKILNEVISKYTIAAALLYNKLSYEELKKNISKISQGTIDFQEIQDQVVNNLSKLADNNGKLDITSMVEDMVGNEHTDNIITPSKSKRKGPDAPLYTDRNEERLQIEEDNRKYHERQAIDKRNIEEEPSTFQQVSASHTESPPPASPVPPPPPPPSE